MNKYWFEQGATKQAKSELDKLNRRIDSLRIETGTVVKIDGPATVVQTPFYDEEDEIEGEEFEPDEVFEHEISPSRNSNTEQQKKVVPSKKASTLSKISFESDKLISSKEKSQKKRSPNASLEKKKTPRTQTIRT